MKERALILFIFIGSISFGIDSTEIAMNHKLLIHQDKVENLSFFTFGHTYGAWSPSVFPSPSINGYVDTINNANPHFILLLGDNYRALEKLHIDKFKSSFLDRINCPVFNAVGNHDLAKNIPERKLKDYDKYRMYFNQKTFYTFQRNYTQFVVLDSELSLNGNIKNEQLSFFKEVSNQVLTSSDSIKNIIVAVHKELNLYDNNYKQEIRPILAEIANKGIQVFLLTGDMFKQSNDLYMEKDDTNNITYLHSHIRDNEEDKILNIQISPEGIIEIIPVSLLGLPVKKLSEYQFHLKKEPKSPLRAESLLKKIKRWLTHPLIIFLHLIITGLLLFFLIKRKKH